MIDKDTHLLVEALGQVYIKENNGEAFPPHSFEGLQVEIYDIQHEGGGDVYEFSITDGADLLNYTIKLVGSKVVFDVLENSDNVIAVKEHKDRIREQMLRYINAYLRR
jgi:hypothetical protein